MRFRVTLFFWLTAFLLLGCERVRTRPLEPRPYLEIPPEGEVLLLPPGGSTQILAHLYPGTQNPTGWVLRWAGEGPVSSVQGELSLPVDRTGVRGIWRARIELWPLEALPPGTYRLWVEVQGANLPPSGEARVRLLTEEEFRSFLRAPFAQANTSISSPLPPVPSPSWTPTLPPTPPPSTATPIPTPTPLPCYRASFIRDVTLPDGTRVPEGYTGEKVWRLRNNGSCTWPANTAIVQMTSGRFLAPSNQGGYFLGREVPPGAEVDVRVPLWIQEPPDRYRVDFMLRAPDGTLFGVGQQADRPFWMDIIVEAPATVTPTPTPADTQAPTIGAVQASTQQLGPPPCTPNTVTVEAFKVDDPSGIDAVVLRWRVVDGSRAGPWVETPMNSQGSGYYIVTLDYATISSNLATPYQQAWFQFQVKASDVYGNTQYSAPQNVRVYDYCVQ